MRDESQVAPHGKNGTFTFIHNNITHDPYALNTMCELRNDEYPDPTATIDTGGDATYFSFRCSLEAIGNWIRWLQEKEIYANTKIIIVSDHGNHYAPDPMNTNNINPEIWDSEDYRFTRIHALLMIKDFAQYIPQQDSLQIDNRFMSNADTAAIIYHSIDGYTPPANAHFDDKYDPTKITAPSSRTLPVYHTDLYGGEKFIKEQQFEIIHKYLVTDNIFEPDNWEKIQ